MTDTLQPGISPEPRTISGKRILVTGGSGFVGSHLVEALIRGGAEVAVVSRGTSNRPDHLASVRDTIRLIHANIQEARFESVLGEGGYDAVFHLAGTASVQQSVADPYSDFENNLVMAIRLLDLFRRKCPDVPLIISSSVAVYGNPVRLPMKETDPTIPISPYGIGKLAVEQYAAVYSRLYGIPTASLRLFSVYGPRQRQLVVYDLIARLHADPSALTVLGDGTETRDLIHVRDVARAAITVFERGALTGEVYNVATGRSHTVLDIAQTIARVMKVTPRITVTGRRRAGDPVNWCADIGKIRQLGFAPEIELAEGIADTVDWFRRTL
jgi:UDP-glucose 4-epimerase